MNATVVSGQVKPQSRFATDFKAPHLSLLFLSVILVASIAVRAGAWLHWHTGAIESEGAE